MARQDKEKREFLSRFGAQDEFCRRASSWNMTNLRNLALRPAKPALGNGHVQRLGRKSDISSENARRRHQQSDRASSQ
jgi:hypothetical protein